jgi:hypothetical protein
MREASQRVPKLSNGLPEGFHRADLLSPESVVRGFVKPLELDTLSNLTELKRAVVSTASGALAAMAAASTAPLPTSSDTFKRRSQPNVTRDERQSGHQVEAYATDNGRRGREEEVRDASSQNPNPNPSQSSRPLNRSAEAPNSQRDSPQPVEREPEVSSDYRLPTAVLDERQLRLAFVPLHYDEGYPVLPNGKPFWQQFEFEPRDAFTGFQCYLKQGATGSRQLFMLAESHEAQQAISKARIALDRLSQVDNPSLNSNPNLRAPEDEDDGFGPVPGSRLPEVREPEDSSRQGPLSGSGFISEASGGGSHLSSFSTSLESRSAEIIPLNGADIGTLQEWFHLYHWGTRAHSHDLYYSASVNASREMLALQLDNTHFGDANRLYMRLMGLMNGEGADFVDAEGRSLFWKGIAKSPRNAIELLAKIHGMQRLAIGMPQSAPGHLKALGNPNPNAGQENRPTRGRGTHSSSSVSEEVGRSTSQGSTSRSQREGQDLTDEQRARRLAILLDRARSRKAGGVPPNG